MKNILFHIILLMLLLMPLPNLMAQHQPASDAIYNSPTEGVIDHKFIPEKQMMEGMLQMVAKFAPYLVSNYFDRGKQNVHNHNYAGFHCKETMFNTEDGIRTTSDLGLAAGFLFKYGRDNNIRLPDTITYNMLYTIALRSLVFIYSTHISNKLARCRNNAYWGSEGSVEQFESPLWAMGMAYQAYMLWDSLSVVQRNAIRNVLVTESDFVLYHPIRCRLIADTRAEENGWDVCVLAATLGLFPDYPNSGRYFSHLRRLSINTLSHRSDRYNSYVIDPDIDTLSVAGAFVANNLFDDYTLQNHDRFHPGYQNVVIQELGEAALALRLFQEKTIGMQKYQTNAILHNCKTTMDSVLCYLALPDGELAMPNGNDWSMFLFDQITSYSTLACMERNPDALMLENQAYKNIMARQQTTSDGTWLLNPDLGARRLGVQAHRVLMSYLMHLVFPTMDIRPSQWSHFFSKHQGTRYFNCQELFRSASPERLVFFSLNNNQDVSGYFVPNSPDLCKIVVPMPNMHGTGNFLGWYNINNNYSNKTRICQPNVVDDANGLCITTMYYVSSYYFSRMHALYCTPGNAVISMDMVRCSKGKHSILEENCGTLALSFDPFTSTVRRFYHEGGCDVVADTSQWCRPSGWLNIDNCIGILDFNTGKKMRMSQVTPLSSINTRVLSMSYSADTTQVSENDIVGRHANVYLSNVSASKTREMQQRSYTLDGCLTDGWMGMVCADNKGTYVLLSNFFGLNDEGFIQDLPIKDGQYMPVISPGISIVDNKVRCSLRIPVGHSVAFRAGFMVKADNVDVVLEASDRIVVSARSDARLSVAYSNPSNGSLYRISSKLRAGESRAFIWTGRRIKALDIR